MDQKEKMLTPTPQATYCCTVLAGVSGGFKVVFCPSLKKVLSPFNTECDHFDGDADDDAAAIWRHVAGKHSRW